MIIRKATRKDIPSIINLVKQIVDYHRRIDKYYGPLARVGLKEHIGKSIRGRKKRIVVAEKDEEIIGYFTGAVEKAPKYVSAEKIGVIFDAFVEKKYRNQGVGRKLLDELLDWFKKNKIKHVEVTVDARNKIGLKAWKDFGFFEYRLKMRLDL